MYAIRLSLLCGVLLALVAGDVLAVILPAPVETPLRLLLDDLANRCAPLPASLDASARAQLDTFYRQRDDQPAWRDAAHLDALREQLDQLADDGLAPTDYPLPSSLDPTPGCADLLASHTYLRALQHLHGGRLNQARLEPLWRPDDAPRPDPRLLVLSIALRDLDEPARAFAAARPALPQYQTLRTLYASLRQRPLANWGTLPDGPLLRPGRNDPRVPTLRQRLAAEGYLQGEPASRQDTRFDPELVAALEEFQRSHALKPDGILGPASLAELNVDALTRRDQLRVNLERLRWLAGDLATARLAINVAAAELLVFENGREVWRTRTQVGRPTRQTPLLASQIDRLTLNPRWIVPPTILREDKLPEIRRDPGYLDRHQMSVQDRAGNRLDPAQVDWDNPGPIRLSQAAGPQNPLGRLALRFPNPFAVYLHDTPSQLLFEKSPRFFSSGCVRVEAVNSLLAYFLSPEELADVELRLASGRTQEYRVRPKVPLLIGYWTVEVDTQGRPRYAPDIYGHDPLLLKALLGIRP
ncbi:L,D-transpeptidase family protein [Zestomonas carbonaria]|uniref:Putative L,D-transpeptidase YcbB n=1 Tax=Zestomonas carbonaria TaxID=2762745 RepID=A0A7U7EIV0_9GAMM|nr:L,D-transpeptidase family protein [Pseudomonas carbonaria]CAD5105843.1 putative L,D-transpeptidase YcbB [Pseudomonas carbonaria]